MNAVAERIEQNSQVTRAPEQRAVSVMSLISEAVKSGLPMETIRELRQMAKEEAREIAEQAFNASMKAAQSEMRSISADAENTQTRSRYATYAKLDAALRPIYTKHGFSVSFDEGDAPEPGYILCLAYVAHEAGFTRTYRKAMPADGKGARGGDVMTKTHAAGAAASYGMRYLLKGIFNVSVGDDDKDGNIVSDVISAAQVEEMQSLIDQAVDARPGTDRAEWLTSFLDYMRVPALNEISTKDFTKGKVAISNLIKQAGK